MFWYFFFSNQNLPQRTAAEEDIYLYESTIY